MAQVVVTGCIAVTGTGTQVELDGEDALLTVTVLVVPVIIEVLLQRILVRVDNLLGILCSLAEVLASLLIRQVVIHLRPGQIHLSQCGIGSPAGSTAQVTLTVLAYLGQLVGSVRQVIHNLLVHLCL